MRLQSSKPCGKSVAWLSSPARPKADQGDGGRMTGVAGGETGTTIAGRAVGRIGAAQSSYPWTPSLAVK